MNNIRSIVWNGCDTYEFSISPIYKGSQVFYPFLAIEIPETELPIIDGEVNYNGVFAVVGAKGWQYFKAL